MLLTFRRAVNTNLTEVGKGLPTVLNNLIGYIFKGNYSYPIGTTNMSLSFDYSLTGEPEFFEDYFSLDISGDIVASGDPVSCPYKKADIPSNYTGKDSIAVVVEYAVLRCALWQGKNPWLLQSVVETALNVTLDNRVSVHARLKDSPSWTFTDPTSLMSIMSLDFYVPFTRTDLKPPVTFLSFETGIRIVSNAEVFSNKTGALTVYNITLSGFTAKEVDKQWIPQVYLQQISAEDWPSLEKEANLILSSFFPKTIPFALPINNELRNIAIQTSSQYILVAFDVV